MHIGTKQTLPIVERNAGGFILSDGQGNAFLPHRFVEGTLEVGDPVEVFLYTERDGTVVATPSIPPVQVGGFAALEVVDLGPPGAFLDWGLERDLFVPFALQHRALEIGDVAVVAVDVDDQDRIFGSTKLAEFFDRNVGDLTLGQEVQILVYAFNPSGALVVVDGRYTGILYHDTIFERLAVGDSATAWITAIREDRVDVSLQRTGRKGTLDARETLLAALADADGFLPLHDRSPPAAIRKHLAMSKKTFKKAVGALYKERRITLEPDGIRLQ